MPAPQSRPRPRSSSQLSTGTLSRGRITWLQLGQALGGCATDSPRGTRHTTTLRKEPTSRPSSAQASTSSITTGPPVRFAAWSAYGARSVELELERGADELAHRQVAAPVVSQNRSLELVGVAAEVLGDHLPREPRGRAGVLLDVALRKHCSTAEVAVGVLVPVPPADHHDAGDVPAAEPVHRLVGLVAVGLRAAAVRGGLGDDGHGARPRRHAAAGLARLVDVASVDVVDAGEVAADVLPRVAGGAGPA